MKSRSQIEQELSAFIASALDSTISAEGEASLLVSGGSTPKELFKKLSEIDLEWEKVTITLVDERYLPDDHQDQNGRMLQSNLLQHHAAKANFIPLVTDINNSETNLKEARKAVAKINQPFTIVLLGMGTDGHTASLFPDADQLNEALDLNQTEDLMIIKTGSSPYERITFTRKALLNSKHLLLHCYGNEKKEVLEQAKEMDTHLPYPIEAFLHQEKVNLEIFWTN